MSDYCLEDLCEEVPKVWDIICRLEHDCPVTIQDITLLREDDIDARLIADLLAAFQAYYNALAALLKEAL